MPGIAHTCARAQNQTHWAQPERAERRDIRTPSESQRSERGAAGPTCGAFAPRCASAAPRRLRQAASPYWAHSAGAAPRWGVDLEGGEVAAVGRDAGHVARGRVNQDGALLQLGRGDAHREVLPGQRRGPIWMKSGLCVRGGKKVRRSRRLR